MLDRLDFWTLFSFIDFDTLLGVLDASLLLEVESFESRLGSDLAKVLQIKQFIS